MFTRCKVPAERHIHFSFLLDGRTLEETNAMLLTSGYGQLSAASHRIMVRYHLPVLQLDPKLVYDFSFKPPTITKLKQLLEEMTVPQSGTRETIPDTQRSYVAAAE